MKRSTFLAGLASTILTACSSRAPSKFRRYSGPEVTRIVLYKRRRRLFLMHNGDVLKSYRIRLGFTARGHKQYEGDGRTPEGNYLIDRKNPNSSFHLSVGISYPNQRDRANARAIGRSPGGDIFIHGAPRRGSSADPSADWTAGCIAVTDREIEEIYAMVQLNTPITIHP
ncbi:L,D-transpeptidase family protein [Halocynthiibacter sp.]|uniref:L,D-transpeptidase family protein n=1 Tax=Halocynthiibacter sp. TaxID=1979210 RepID=UPI003C3726C9